jgi:hypothetical protein
MNTITSKDGSPREQIVTGAPSGRRSFFKVFGGGVLGVSQISAGTGGIEHGDANTFEPLWSSALVLIGNSPGDQIASPVIQCPLFYDNGHFANASHSLDLSRFPQVHGTITLGKDTVEPDFSSSVAAAGTLGSDSVPYLIVAGEGKINRAPRAFRDVTSVLIRCKYKVADPGSLLLIACVDCVVILVHN